MSEDAEQHSSDRQLFIDNFRWIIIVLVLSMHAADTYSPLGSWYFVDRRPILMPTLVFFAAWQMYLQAFFMGTLFLIAGYFVPHSLDRKGALKYVCDRLIRLGLPVLLYMLVIGPVTEYFVAHSWTSSVPTSFAHEWVKHIQNGEVLQENGPLWFCVALLILSLTYVVCRAFAPAKPLRAPFVDEPPRAAGLIGLALLIAIATFLVRLARPPSIGNLPLRDFAQYIVLFGVGILGARRRWMTQLRLSIGIRCMAFALGPGLLAWYAMLRSGGFFNGNTSAFFVGLHWQSAAFALWESCTCVAMCYGFLAVLRAKFDTQGRVAEFMSANAFSVYVFHPPILILAARLIHGFTWPSVGMFLTLTVLAVIGSFTLSSTVFRRLPLLQRIL